MVVLKWKDIVVWLDVRIVIYNVDRWRDKEVWPKGWINVVGIWLFLFIIF